MTPEGPAAATAPPPPPTAASSRCPACGATLAPRQRACLECGRDLTRSYRRGPNWRIWPVIVGLAALALGTAAGILISAAVHTKTKQKTIVTATAPAPTAAAPAPAPPAATPPATPTTPATVPIATWPAGKRAYTVVLVSARRQAQAVATARDAARRGIPAGLLRSDDHGLPPGSWIVFAGQYASAAAANGQAGAFAQRGFPRAHAQFVRK